MPFAASTPLSRGVDGKPGVRHAPTLINRAWGKSQFWDGRAPTLEAQVISPVTNPDEMGMTTDGVVQKIRGIKGYAPLFAAAFGDSAITFDRIAKAIATFERTIVSGNSALRPLPCRRQVGADQSSRRMAWISSTRKVNAPNATPGRTSPTRNSPTWEWAWTGSIPIRAATPLQRSAAISANSKCPLCATLPIAPPTCTTAASKPLAEVLDLYAKGGLPNPHLDTRLTPFYMDEETTRSAGFPRCAQRRRLAEHHPARRVPAMTRVPRGAAVSQDQIKRQWGIVALTLRSAQKHGTGVPPVIRHGSRRRWHVNVAPTLRSARVRRAGHEAGQ